MLAIVGVTSVEMGSGFGRMGCLLGIVAAACGARSTGWTDGFGSESGYAHARLYIANSESSSISGFEIEDSGALRELPGSPFALGFAPTAMVASPDNSRLYVAGALSPIYTTLSIAPESGTLTLVPRVLPNASGGGVVALAVSPDGRHVYAGTCIGPAGAIVSTRVDAAGAAQQTTPLTFCPNGMVVNPKGTALYTSLQYADAGEVEGFALEPGTGNLIHPITSPFDFFTALDIAGEPRGNFYYVTDQLSVIHKFKVDPVDQVSLQPTGSRPSTGANPFTIEIDDLGRFLFVANWSGSSVSVFELNSDGDPVSAPNSPFVVPPNPTTLSTDPQGRYLYVGAQGSSELTAFAVGESGALTALPGSPFQTGMSPIAAVIIR